jgi:hypothetical protein
MDAVTGVFRSRDDARRGATELCRAGFSPSSVNVLLPGAPEQEIHSIPSSETESPGVGAAIGGVVGAAVGIGGGFELGTAAASLMVPGVGPIVAMGIAAAALFGTGGLFAGAALGSAADKQDTGGLPADEIFFYEDALRQGRSVVIVLPKDGAEAEKARELLATAGAESLDAARDAWWIGLRGAEAEHYSALGYNFERDHDSYRAGFEAGLRNATRGKTYQASASYLKSQYPKVWQSEAFRAGFDRGQSYISGRQTGLRAGGG